MSLQPSNSASAIKRAPPEASSAAIDVGAKFTTPSLPKRARMAGSIRLQSSLSNRQSNSESAGKAQTSTAEDESNFQALLAARREMIVSIYGPDVHCLPCLCRVPEEIKINVDAPDGCQAQDSVNNATVDCGEPLSSDLPVLGRCHVRDRLKAMCENHHTRLRMHNCCPGCGIFCVKGQFNKCRETVMPHYFHIHCVNELGQCPHCLSTNFGLAEIDLTTLPVTGPAQARTRMSLSRSVPQSAIDWINRQTDSQRRRFTHRLSGTDKEICTADLADPAQRDLIRKAINGIDLNLSPTPDIMEKAMADGDLRIVLSFLVKKFDLDMRLASRLTLLQHAANNDQWQICFALIELGANMDVTDDEGRTALMMAAAAGHYRICKLLKLFGKANVHIKDKSNDTALHLAAKAGAADVVEFFIYGGDADLDEQDSGGWTPLMWAAENGQVYAVKALLKAGADRLIVDKEGNIALHWAAMSGVVYVGTMLLKHKQEEQINKQNKLGYTPLMIACRELHGGFIDLLLLNGADTKIEDNEHKTAETYLRSRVQSDDHPMLVTLQSSEKLRTAMPRVRKQSGMIMSNLAQGKEKVWISVWNDVDDAKVDDLIYVTKLVETSPDTKVDWSVLPNLMACSCKSDCGGETMAKECLCILQGNKPWYEDNGRLVADFPYQGPEHSIYIFECNALCRCPKSCRNRVVQNGITVNLKLARTADRGWGVFANEDIPKGTFICEYAGELITDREAEARTDDTYLFELYDATLPNATEIRNWLCVDAKNYGNISRFINHGCEGNLIPLKVFYDHVDMRAPHLAFFASKDIRKNEELTFDYGPKFWSVKGQQFSCKCGSHKCVYSADKMEDFIRTFALRQQQRQDGLATLGHH